MADAIYTPVYIDLYVNNPDVICIDQHIIGYDETHNQRLAALQTKINPNLMRKDRTFRGNYFHKYPFGTVHFLIALLEREGMQVELPMLGSSTGSAASQYNLAIGDILLRADDAMYSSLGKYKPNTEEWWQWLLELSGDGVAVKSMIHYINDADPRSAGDVKRRTGNFFIREFGCSGGDGAYDDVTDEQGVLKDKVLAYRDEICRIMGMQLDLPMKYNIHMGTASKTSYIGGSEFLEYTRNPGLYSYAFIYGPKSQKGNFSFTQGMK